MFGLVAIVLPLISVVALVLVQARAQEAARAVAREVARGEQISEATAHGQAALPGSSTAVSTDADRAKVTVSLPVQLPFGPSYTVHATAMSTIEQP